MSQAARAFWAKAHFWLSLAVGAQVVIWIATGLFFSLNPIEQVRGAHLRAEVPPALIDWRQTAVSPEEAAAALGLNAAELRLVMLGDQPTYLVSGPDGPAGLVNAATGAASPSLSQEQARGVAEAAFAAEGALSSLSLLVEGPKEYGRDGPVWAAEFAAPGRPVFYIDAMTGDVRAVRTDQWRWFDLMWGFHIMDWEGREDINNAFLVTASVLALAFSVSGVALSLQGLRRRARHVRP